MIMDVETGHERLAMAMSDGESRDALTLRELQLTNYKPDEGALWRHGIASGTRNAAFTDR